uniref:Albumin n=1 Tax=Strigops habroptila TaxID=2489341 RepID=A0A672UZJ6_STRHB
MVLYLSTCACHLNNFVSRGTFENVSCYVSYLHIPKHALCFSSMITFAQYLQRCSYEGLSKMVKDVVDLAQKCVTNEDAPECTKSLPSIFLDEICQMEKLRDSYGAMADCCSKADPERNQCFLSFKVAQPDFIQPYQRPAADVVCKDYQDNRVSFMGHFIYSVARRTPFLYAPTILGLAADYERVLQSCCKESDIGACLDEKVYPVFHCGIKTNIFSSFPLSKLARLSQKYPKAPLSELVKIVQDIKGVYKECCEGDMIECMDDKAELVSYMCSKQDVFSSKIKDCCAKPVVERSQCIMEADFDEKPADLPSLVEKYVHDKEVCKSFEAGHDAFLSEFVYEYARRHPEFSTQLILRVAKGYETLLEKCCKTDNPAECYGNQEDLNKHIKETQDVVKTNCDFLATHGEADFLKKMTSIGNKCCKLSEDKRLPCSEGYLGIVIQEMCKKQETTPINDNVSQCCSDSYANRRPCFTAMGVDTKYVPPAFNPDMFSFDEKLCTAAPAERELGQMNKVVDWEFGITNRLLINLIKRKPQMTEEQIKTIANGFTAMVDKCCKQSDIETCFGEEAAWRSCSAVICSKHS